MMSALLKNKLVRNIASAVAVAVLGFVLLNLTFIFDALYQSVIRRLVGLFLQLGPDMSLYWFPPLMHASFVVVIGLISWLVFRSSLGVLYKASYLTVPVAVVLVTVGMFLYRWQAVSYAVAGMLCVGTLYWFYRTKQPWLYHYVVVLVGLTLAVYALSGGEI